jgi:hypothetical protein
MQCLDLAQPKNSLSPCRESLIGSDYKMKGKESIEPEPEKQRLGAQVKGALT